MKTRLLRVVQNILIFISVPSGIARNLLGQNKILYFVRSVLMRVTLNSLLSRLNLSLNDMRLHAKKFSLPKTVSLTIHVHYLMAFDLYV